MLGKILKNRFFLLNFFFLVFLSIFLTHNFIYSKYFIYKNRTLYQELMFKCDNSMRDHFIAKQFFNNKSNEINYKKLKATEVGLLDCHEYDIMRKSFLELGISEEKLSLIGLEALEQKGNDIKSFIDIHEIEY